MSVGLVEAGGALLQCFFVVFLHFFFFFARLVEAVFERWLGGARSLNKPLSVFLSISISISSTHAVLSKRRLGEGEGKRERRGLPSPQDDERGEHGHAPSQHKRDDGRLTHGGGGHGRGVAEVRMGTFLPFKLKADVGGS